MSFLCITSYCRREAPFSTTVHGKELAAHDKPTWTAEADKAFKDLKSAPANATTLGLPNSNKRGLCYIGFVSNTW